MQVVQKWVSAIKTILGATSGPVAKGLKIGKHVLDNVTSTSLAPTLPIALMLSTELPETAIIITVMRKRKWDLALADITPAHHNC